jgi:hypothetical protein
MDVRSQTSVQIRDMLHLILSKFKKKQPPLYWGRTDRFYLYKHEQSIHE